MQVRFSLRHTFQKYEHKHEQIGKRQWKDAAIVAFTLFLGGQGLLTCGAQYLSSGITGLLNSAIPLWVAVIAFLIFRKHMTKLILMGLAAGFGGLMLIVAPSIGNGTVSPIGVSALIISSISWAIGWLYSSKAKLTISCVFRYVNDHRWLNAYFRQLSARRILGSRPIPDFWPIPGCTNLFDNNFTVVGFTDFYWLLRVTTPSLANTFAYVSPVIAVILGWAILKESITTITIVAMVVILLGVALMVTTPKKSKIVKSYKKI